MVKKWWKSTCGYLSLSWKHNTSGIKLTFLWSRNGWTHVSIKIFYQLPCFQHMCQIFIDEEKKPTPGHEPLISHFVIHDNVPLAEYFPAPPLWYHDHDVNDADIKNDNLTHCPLEHLAVILNEQLLNSYQGQISWPQVNATEPRKWGQH